MGRKAVLGGLLAAACLAGFGCAANLSPVPKITSISPASVPAGEGAFPLSISGLNMNGSSSVGFGTNSLTVLSVETPPCAPNTNCAVTVVVSVPASQVSAPGPQQLNVTTNGQTSNDVTFNVTSPQILTVSPNAVPAGSASFPLTLTVLNASQFVEVFFGTPSNTNKPLVPAGPVSCVPVTACTVVVNVPAADVKTAGAVPLVAINPLATSGGTAMTNFMVASTSGGKFPIAQSAGSGGALGNASSTHSSVSDGGLFVAFDSTASNLTSTSTNGLSQVYVTQNCFGAASCTPHTTLISAASGGAAGAGGVNGSDRPVISADGRYVAFESDDTNLVSGVTAAVEQIYLYDTCNSISGPAKNCTPAMTLVSAKSGTPGNAPSMYPAISSFGLYVAFQSTATNLASLAVPANVDQIYLYQNCTSASGATSGCTTGARLFSTDANGSPGDGNSVSPSIDPAGLAVAFQSLADNIVSGVPSNGSQQIYLRTTCLEAVPLLQAGCGKQTVLVSADSSNAPGTGDSITPALADSGNLYVAFASSAPDILPANATAQQIIGVTVCTTLPTTVDCTPSGDRVLSVDQNGVPGAAESLNPAVSGTFGVFTSQASLLAGVTGQQVYGVPICAAAGPCPGTATLISADPTGTAVGGDLGSIGGGGMAAFYTTGSAGAPGIGEIFLAPPF
jgi:hypothetical protein